jgi:hypothetical protein
MENILFGLFSAILLIISILIMATTSLRSVNTISTAFNTMEQRFVEISNTSIDLQFVEYSAGLLKLRVQNIGQIDLKNFGQWDALVQRADGSSSALTYVSGPVAAIDEWTIQGIFLTTDHSEVFDPGILNPDEVMVVVLNVPDILPGQTVKVTMATSNGVTAQCMASA